jgi:hypothetical protein
MSRKIVRQGFLVSVFMAVMVVALGYGASPEFFTGTLLGSAAADTNTSHILRAVMGLYIANGLFWLYGAFNAKARDYAIAAFGLFCASLLAGRILSLLIDGMPSPLLLVYTGIEVVSIPMSIWMYRMGEDAAAP